VEGSTREGENLNVVQHGLLANQEFQSVPHIIEILTLDLGVLHASRVSDGNEVSNSAMRPGGGMP